MSLLCPKGVAPFALEKGVNLDAPTGTLLAALFEAPNGYLSAGGERFLENLVLSVVDELEALQQWMVAETDDAMTDDAAERLLLRARYRLEIGVTLAARIREANRVQGGTAEAAQ